jgi:hypothetical protein
MDPAMVMAPGPEQDPSVQQVGYPYPAPNDYPQQEQAVQQVSDPYPAPTSYPQQEQAVQQATYPYPAPNGYPQQEQAVQQVSNPYPAPTSYPQQDQAVQQVSSPYQAPTGYPQQEQAVLQVNYPYPAPRGFPRGEAPPARMSYVDITASSSFAHAPDYSWLRGQVEYSRKGLRLRYATVDEDDPYGGSVTLTGSNALEQLKDGQEILVQGHLNEADAGRTPGYRVESLQFIQAGN